MKIVITGGTGFIGSSLIPRLTAEGHDVVLFTRGVGKISTDARLTIKQWDGKTQGAWSSSLDGADAVLNFAGESIAGKRWTAAQKKRIVESRVSATAAIIKAIEDAGKKPRVLVSASAVGFYGPVQDGDVAEDHPRGNTFLSYTTDQWEQVARKAERSGVRVVIPRIGVVLGERGGALEKMLLPFKMFVGGPIGSGTQWFPWIHIDDLAGLILFALSKENISGVVNAVAPGVVTMKEFCSSLGSAMHRPSWAPVPGLVLKIALGEMSEMLLTGQRVVPRALEHSGYHFKYPQLGPALSDILAGS